MTKIAYICKVCKEPMPEDFFIFVQSDLAHYIGKMRNPNYNSKTTKSNSARMKKEQLCPVCMKKLLIKEIMVFTDELQQEINETRERYKDES